jgi:hypothetical protein
MKPRWVICHAWLWVNMILSKSFFCFPDRQEWCSFHKITDFSCSHCVKRLFYSAFVWKCASTVLEFSCCRIHRYVAAPYLSSFARVSPGETVPPIWYWREWAPPMLSLLLHCLVTTESDVCDFVNLWVGQCCQHFSTFFGLIHRKCFILTILNKYCCQIV